MTAILSLGSNLGDRRAALDSALVELAGNGVRIVRVSPVVETPAMLPSDAPGDWNRPFLNLAVECSTELSAARLLALAKEIECSLGRESSPRWSPRPIDIDIALFDDARVHEPGLTIPHPGLLERAFVLAPLAAIAPQRVIPGTGGLTALAAYRRLRSPIPLWMGIVNVTPDSFSDGGRHLAWDAVAESIASMTEAGAAIIDFGAESTRPGAEPLTADQEWQRLAPILERAIDAIGTGFVRPAISVDTYHADVARRAIELGADIINDVGGLTDPAMIAIAAASDVEWIAMHHVSLPADPARTLSGDSPATDQVRAWLAAQRKVWIDAGIDTTRIVFDPGVGFGKTPLQSLELLRGIERFVTDDFRVLVGHSRKSFMRTIGPEAPAGRDLPTIGASLELGRRGVDILRVHNVADHVSAWRGFAHVRRS